MAEDTVRQECDERTGEYRENEAGEDRDPLHHAASRDPEAVRSGVAVRHHPNGTCDQGQEDCHTHHPPDDGQCAMLIQRERAERRLH